MTSQEIQSTNGPSLAEQIYADIKRDILRCHLAPGDLVTELQLVDRYDSGRAGVRVALNRLYQERLVQPVPRRGYLIAPITLKGVDELFAVRMILEPAAARLAVGKVDAESLNAFDAELRGARYRLGDDASAEAFLSINTDFHVAIARGSGNDRLACLLEDLLHEMERLFHFGLMNRDRNEEMYHEHRELIQALLNCDPDRAEEVARAQIRSSQAMVSDALLSHSNVVSTSLRMS